MSKTNNYNLEERTLTFSKNTIIFCKETKLNICNQPLIEQLIRSATSVGANYCEANGASSKKDFRNKIYICKKESKETRYWLLLLLQTDKENTNKINELLKETQEFIFIFSKIISTLNNKN